MQIATWNVNSIRTRLTQVLTWLANNPKIDVLCLQETKVVDGDFPLAAFQELGWHLEIYGQKSYNGVAIATRQPLERVKLGFGEVLELPELEQFEAQKRVICGNLNGVAIANLYVPNGSEVGSEKYIYKLAWLAMLKLYLQELLSQNPLLLVCGDFNIALEDIDIHNAKGREAKVMSTDAEREALRTVLDLGFTDAFRKFTSETGHYSWWDYRAGGFARNRGWRIDHYYVSEDLAEKVSACWIDIEPRKQSQPSDHTPVIIDI
jgi:exodeoxyribonuclease III